MPQGDWAAAADPEGKPANLFDAPVSFDCIALFVHPSPGLAVLKDGVGSAGPGAPSVAPSILQHTCDTVWLLGQQRKSSSFTLGLSQVQHCAQTIPNEFNRPLTKWTSGLTRFWQETNKQTNNPPSGGWRKH